LFRFSRKADYAIVLLSHLARRDGRLASACELAAASRLTRPLVANLLKELARGGLLDSVRGVRGGYRLARPAWRIALTDILAAVDGPLSIVECTGDPTGACCGLSPICPSRPAMVRLQTAVRALFAGVSLADLSSEAPLLAAPQVSR
jgi:Rrf2 family protein